MVGEANNIKPIGNAALRFTYVGSAPKKAAILIDTDNNQIYVSYNANTNWVNYITNITQVILEKKYKIIDILFSPLLLNILNLYERLYYSILYEQIENISEIKFERNGKRGYVYLKVIDNEGIRAGFSTSNVSSEYMNHLLPIVGIRKYSNTDGKIENKTYLYIAPVIREKGNTAIGNIVKQIKEISKSIITGTPILSPDLTYSIEPSEFKQLQQNQKNQGANALMHIIGRRVEGNASDILSLILFTNLGEGKEEKGIVIRKVESIAIKRSTELTWKCFLKPQEFVEFFMLNSSNREEIKNFIEKVVNKEKILLFSDDKGLLIEFLVKENNITTGLQTNIENLLNVDSEQSGEILGKLLSVLIKNKYKLSIEETF